MAPTAAKSALGTRADVPDVMATAPPLRRRCGHDHAPHRVEFQHEAVMPVLIGQVEQALLTDIPGNGRHRVQPPQRAGRIVNGLRRCIGLAQISGQVKMPGRLQW